MNCLLTLEIFTGSVLCDFSVMLNTEGFCQVSGRFRKGSCCSRTQHENVRLQSSSGCQLYSLLAETATQSKSRNVDTSTHPATSLHKMARGPPIRSSEIWGPFLMFSGERFALKCLAYRHIRILSNEQPHPVNRADLLSRRWISLLHPIPQTSIP